MHQWWQHLAQFIFVIGHSLQCWLKRIDKLHRATILFFYFEMRKIWFTLLLYTSLIPISLISTQFQSMVGRVCIIKKMSPSYFVEKKIAVCPPCCGIVFVVLLEVPLMGTSKHVNLDSQAIKTGDGSTSHRKILTLMVNRRFDTKETHNDRNLLTNLQRTDALMHY